MIEIELGGQLRARVLTTGADTGGAFDLVDATMPAGAATPLHLHARYAERLWVLEGVLSVVTGAERVELGAGGFHVIPPDTPHMVSTSDGARALSISSPAAFAELLIRTGVPAEEADAIHRFDPELFARVSAELGDQVLGPPGAQPSEVVD